MNCISSENLCNVNVRTMMRTFLLITKIYPRLFFVTVGYRYISSARIYLSAAQILNTVHQRLAL